MWGIPSLKLLRLIRVRCFVVLESHGFNKSTFCSSYCTGSGDSGFHDLRRRFSMEYIRYMECVGYLHLVLLVQNKEGRRGGEKNRKSNKHKHNRRRVEQVARQYLTKTCETWVTPQTRIVQEKTRVRASGRLIEKIGTLSYARFSERRTSFQARRAVLAAKEADTLGNAYCARQEERPRPGEGCKPARATTAAA